MLRIATMIAIGLVAAAPATAQLQSKHQIRCLKELWKSSVQVAKAQGQECAACAKSATLGRLAPMTGEQCMYADLKQKVTKQQQRTVAIAGEKCEIEWPTFGATDPDTVNVASAQSQIDLAADLLGADVDAGLIDCATDRDACRCQVKTLQAAAGIATTILSNFAGCAKRAVKINTHPFLGGVLSAEEFERCLADDSIDWSVASDPRGQVAKAAAKLDAAIARCGDTSGVFPGACAAASGDELAACLAERAHCRSCLAVNVMFDLDVDCDAFDDGAGNGSCVD